MKKVCFLLLIVFEISAVFSASKQIPDIYQHPTEVQVTLDENFSSLPTIQKMQNQLVNPMGEAICVGVNYRSNEYNFYRKHHRLNYSINSDSFQNELLFGKEKFLDEKAFLSIKVIPLLEKNPLKVFLSSMISQMYTMKSVAKGNLRGNRNFFSFYENCPLPNDQEEEQENASAQKKNKAARGVSVGLPASIFVSNSTFGDEVVLGWAIDDYNDEKLFLTNESLSSGLWIPLQKKSAKTKDGNGYLSPLIFSRYFSISETKLKVKIRDSIASRNKQTKIEKDVKYLDEYSIFFLEVFPRAKNIKKKPSKENQVIMAYDIPLISVTSIAFLNKD